MPSVGHVMVGLAAGRLQARRRQEVAGSMLLFTLVSMLPDLDGIGYLAGVPYEATFGHRGALHSVGMAVVFALAMGLLARFVKLSFARVALVTFGALVVHDLSDAATDGGLGVALWWPLSDARVFLPWTPIPVAPIGLGVLSTSYGRKVVAAELLIFLPFLAYAVWPRREKRAQSVSDGPS